MDRIVIVGSATVDEQVVGSNRPRLQLGGVVSYGGAAFVEHGLAAVAVCNLGSRFADSARAVLQTLHVEPCTRVTGAMTRFRNTLNHDGERRQDLLEIAPPIGTALLRKALPGRRPVHIHLGPVHGRDISNGVLQAIATAADRVTLDVQGLVRSSALGEVTSAASPLLEGALAASVVVKAGGAELSVVESNLGMSPDELLVEYDIAELLVTEGKNGGYLLKKNGQRLDFRAQPVEQLYDTTGAGDVFFSTYLTYRLYRDMAPADALEEAAQTASRHVGGNFIDIDGLALDPR